MKMATMKMAFISKHVPTQRQIELAKAGGFKLVHIRDCDAFSVGKKVTRAWVEEALLLAGRLGAADLVRRARRKSRLNTADFGQLLGVSGRTVESWEASRYTPGGPAMLIIKTMLEEGEDDG